MRHIPFLEVLASVQEASDPAWRDASAGYLVLRFLDRWIEEGPAVMSSDSNQAALKARIRSVHDVEPQVRQILLDAVSALINAPDTNPTVVAGPLMAYGRYLESVSRLKLAAHVYETLAEAVDPPSGTLDGSVAAMAWIRYGYVSRLSGDFDTAERGYHRAEILATRAQDLTTVLQSRVGRSSVIRARGNLAEAEAFIDRIVADAVAAGLAHSESLARHGRAAVLEVRGKYSEAIKEYFAAYQLTDDVMEREIILGDLAGCAAVTGYRKTARDAQRVLAYTATSHVARSYALVNLLELAVLENDRVGFQRLSEELKKHTLSVELSAHAVFYEAKGIERFGTYDAAEEAYRRVAEQAERDQIHQVAFEAMQRLDQLRTKISDASVVAPAVEMPEFLRDVAEAIAAMSAATPAPF